MHLCWVLSLPRTSACGNDTNDDEKSEGEGEEDWFHNVDGREALDEVEEGCTPDSVRGVDDQYDHDT